MKEIRLEGISCSYQNQRVIEGITLQMQGQVVGIYGGENSGKNCLLKTLSRLKDPEEGLIFIDGSSEWKKKDLRKIIGFLPKEFTFYNHLTVYEAIEYMADTSGLTKKERKKRIEGVLIDLELEKFRELKVHRLGRYERVLLGMAQLLVREVALLLLEEPFFLMCEDEIKNFKKFISKVAREKRVIFSTSDCQTLEEICEGIVILEQGRCQYFGDFEGLYKGALGEVYRTKIPITQLSEFKEEYCVTETRYYKNIVEVRFLGSKLLEVEACKLEAQKVEPNIREMIMCIQQGEGRC